MECNQAISNGDRSNACDGLLAPEARFCLFYGLTICL